MATYCGVVLKGEEDESCALAFISEDGVVTYSETDDERIMELLKEHRPSVVTLNAPQQHTKPEETREQRDPDDEDKSPLHPETAKMFRTGEEDLVKEGYSLLPSEMRDRRLLERAEFLSNTIQRSGLGATIIESHPGLVAKKLEITGDRQLEAYGIDTEDIENVYEFDAVLLALTAKFYAEDQYEDRNIILPKSLDEMGQTE